MAVKNDESNVASSSRGSGGSGAPPSFEFSSFRALILEEREAATEKARAEGDAVTERVRVDREVAAADQLHFMIEVFELILRLARGNRSHSGVAGGESWTTGLLESRDFICSTQNVKT